MSDAKFKVFMKTNYPKVKDDSKEWLMLAKAFCSGASSSKLTLDEIKQLQIGTKLFNNESDGECFLIAVNDKYVVTTCCIDAFDEDEETLHSYMQYNGDIVLCESSEIDFKLV